MNMGGPRGRPHSLEVLDSTVTGSTATEGTTPAPRYRVPRSLPPWIDSYEARYGAVTEDQLQLLLNPPTRSVQAQHNSAPSEPQRRVSKDGFVDWSQDPLLDRRINGRRFPAFLKRHDPNRGRKWDHLRTAEPVIVAGYARANKTPPLGWKEFLSSSLYGRMPNEESGVVDVETLNKLQPNFNKEVDIPANPLDTRMSRRKRTVALYKRIWMTAVHHALAPLIFRLTVIITSIISLAISANLYDYEKTFGNQQDMEDAREERAQAIVAVAVDCVAIPYIGYMLWDEYTGKPLGLRSAVQKIMLILMDLFFIIFKSASTSIAFEALVYRSTNGGLALRLSQALAAFMLLGLIAWTMTFVVNVIRTVERLGGGEDEGVHM